MCRLQNDSIPELVHLPESIFSVQTREGLAFHFERLRVRMIQYIYQNNCNKVFKLSVKET